MTHSKPINLRCNYLHNPLGTSLTPPRFSWRMDSTRPGAGQSAYQIQVSHTPDFGDLHWDSGWVISAESIQIQYAGPEPQSMQRYLWRVRIKDEFGEEGEWSKTAWWETGLGIQDWQAEWIEPEKEVDPKAFKPAPYLRKCFDTAQEITSARLYITAHGLYEAYLNGKRISDQVFTPGNTSYVYRLQYQVYDVLEFLKPGENCVGVILGDGWYRGAINAPSTRNAHGEKVALLSQLNITYADGSTQWVVTDNTWKTSTGPIVKSDMKDGEIYDARLEMPGWNEPGFDDSVWGPVYKAWHGYENLIPSEGSPIRRMEAFKPIKIIATPSGQTVLDFGQNMAGYTCMQVQGDRGVTVTLQHSETLDENGNFSLDYLGTDNGFVPALLQQDEYTLKGDGLESFEPRFTVHGFRYVKVEGYPGALEPENFTAYPVYSDMDETGQFECSNPKLNQLHHNIVWSMKGNFLDIPTDCPTRERAGWTGDAQIFIRAGSLLMDDAAFYAKWIKDVGADQPADGRIRNCIPDTPSDNMTLVFKIMEGSAGWGDAIVIIPWTLYRMFGDRTILEQTYDSMKKYVEYQRSSARKTNIFKKINPAFWFRSTGNTHQQYIWDTHYHWGEWLEPDLPIRNIAFDMLKKVLFGDPIVATAYFAYSSRLLSTIASLLGKQEDAEAYAALSEKVHQAYLKEFFLPDSTTTYYPKKQAPYVRALTLGLFDEELRPKLIQKLVDSVEASGRHLNTGFLSTPFLLDILSETGHTDMAYDILLQEDHPSWLYAINKGATTIWEDWDGISEEGVPAASLNHYSKGAVVSWLYEYICGIQLDPEINAYKHFHIRPRPGGGLRYARAKYTSPYGIIESGWEVTGTGHKYTFSIPANTSASVQLLNARDFPNMDKAANFKQEGDSVTFDLSSGSYEFETIGG